MTSSGGAERPVILVGMARSGTTLIFEGLAAHPDLAWFSQYLGRVPWLPQVAVLSRLADHPRLRRWTPPSNARRGLLDELKPGPTEGYGVWKHYCGRKFLFDSLIGQVPSNAERKSLRDLAARLMRYQGKPRLIVKITGPGRIHYLQSAFEDAHFVHVIRDGRAVVDSLMRVSFWRDTYRMRKPAWHGLLADEQMYRWAQSGRDPLTLAAMQWAAVVTTTREEARALPPDRYIEVRYEDFVASPPGVLDAVAAFAGLPASARPYESVAHRVRSGGASPDWSRRLGEPGLAAVEQAIGPLLQELGYRPAYHATVSSMPPPSSKTSA